MNTRPKGGRVRPNADIGGIFLLCILAFPLYWDRVRGGWHLSRVDLVNQFLPNYTYLGAHLRAGDLPVWNPYVNSEIPFLGDSMSGWGYLPAMVSFVLFPPMAALQTTYLIHVLIAGIGMFALARATGLNFWGAITAGVAYEYGSIIEQLRSVNVQAQMTAWIPLGLFGLELALRAKTLRARAGGWSVGALALSQMIVGWTGQGSAYGVLIIASYMALRCGYSVIERQTALISHILRHIADGIAIIAFGLGLSSAGLWIRLGVNKDSLIADGSYDRAYGAVHHANYLMTATLLIRLLIPSRYYYVGGATLALALMAPFIARGQIWRIALYCTYLVLFAAMVVLQGATVRRLIFLMPRFRELHEHNIGKSLVLFGVPLALLAGATVDALSYWHRRWNLLVGLACLPILGAFALDGWFQRYGSQLAVEPKKTMVIVGALICVYALTLAVKSIVPQLSLKLLRIGLLALLIACICWDPFGSTFGRALASRAMILPPRQVFSTFLDKEDQGGPGGFLQNRMEESGPFRFLGYGPSVIASSGSRAETTYHGRFRDPLVVELLFGRTMRLELKSVQGYNPVQSSRYVDFLLAVNGEPQNYHDANVRRTGVLSGLLRLLNLRYIVVGKNDDTQFAEIKQLESKYPTVFEDKTVKVLEVTDALPYAWIVHSAESGDRNDARRKIQRPAYDPATQAFVEGDLPKLDPPNDSSAERVEITESSADQLELSANLTAPGIVVISEMYARGWKAEVDGHSVNILPTDLILRGIPVAAGKHTIKLRYAPYEIPRGIAVTLITICILATLILQPWRYRFPFVNAWRNLLRPLGPPSTESSAMSDQIIQISRFQEISVFPRTTERDVSREIGSSEKRKSSVALR